MEAVVMGYAGRGAEQHGRQHPALSSFVLKGRALRSRAVVAPMSRVSALPDGTPSEAMATYYRTFARGGFGLIIAEGTYPEALFGRAYAGQPGLCAPAHVEGWRRVVDAVHAADTPIIVQLMHAGALSQCLEETVAPSAVMPKGSKLRGYGGEGAFPMPRALSHEEIERLIAAFADAARSAVSAGFDGVELHGANGYLIDQFFTEELNTRSDAYGGSVVNRARFARDVMRAIRAVVPSGFVVGLRISQAKVNDASYRWPGGETYARDLFSVLAPESPDYLHVAGEGLPWADALFPSGTSVTALARELLRVPVIANGALDDPALAATVLARAHADLIALGSGAAANPDWPLRIAAGRTLRPADSRWLRPRMDGAFVEAWAARA